MLVDAGMRRSQRSCGGAHDKVLREFFVFGTIVLRGFKVFENHPRGGLSHLSGWYGDGSKGGRDDAAEVLVVETD